MDKDDSEGFVSIFNKWLVVEMGATETKGARAPSLASALLGYFCFECINPSTPVIYVEMLLFSIRNQKHADVTHAYDERVCVFRIISRVYDIRKKMWHVIFKRV